MVLFLYGGIPDTVEVYGTKKAANARYQEIRRANQRSARDPHNEDCDLYLYEDVEVV